MRFSPHVVRLSADDMLTRIVERGIRLASFTLATTYTTRGGIPKSKTRTDQRDDLIRLEQVAQVLDLMQWYGEWGQTPHAIEMELIRLAKEKRS